MRCLNFDWLEVYCLEPFAKPRDAEYFRNLGLSVKVRDYGTPQYREMFSIMDNEFAMVEVRRNPYSLKKDGGVFEPESCHIRLTNRACYLQDPIKYLRSFLDAHGFSFQSFSRVDLCLDFYKLDDGSMPGDFLQDYAREKYFKLHLSTITPRGVEVVGSDISGHGIDRQFGRQYNSWSWGCPTSAISVKMYDKTMELSEVKDKFYIRDQWLSAGLITDHDNKMQLDIRDTRYYINNLRRKMANCKGAERESMRAQLNAYQAQLRDMLDKVRHIWRLEFSIKSTIKGFVRGDVKDIRKDGSQVMYPIDMHTLGSRDRCLLLFLSLAKKYFWFKVPSKTRNGTPQRKDRCPDYWPIRWDGTEVYKPVRLTTQSEPTRMDRIISNKLRTIIEDANERGGYDQSFLRGLEQLLQYFGYRYRLHELERAHNALILDCCKNIQVDFENMHLQGQELLDKCELLRQACMDMQDQLQDYTRDCENF